MKCCCGIEYGEHPITFRLENKKTYCAWCLIRYDITDDDYEKYGNICSRCSGRCERVVKGFMTIEEADSELIDNRKKNLKIYEKTRNNRN